MAGSFGADVMIVDPTAPCYVRRGMDKPSLFASAKGLSVTSFCGMELLRFLSWCLFWEAGSFCSGLLAEFG